MQPEGSLPCSQNAAICPYLVLDQSSSILPILFLERFIYYIPVSFMFSKWSLAFSVPHQIPLRTYPLLPTCTSYIHLNYI